jgi:hypothetical protein
MFHVKHLSGHGHGHGQGQGQRTVAASGGTAGLNG